MDFTFYLRDHLDLELRKLIAGTDLGKAVLDSLGEVNPAIKSESWTKVKIIMG